MNSIEMKTILSFSIFKGNSKRSNCRIKSKVSEIYGLLKPFSPKRIKRNVQIFSRIKRSADELDNLLNEIASDEELLNLSLHGIDKEKVQNSPLLQYLLLRKPSLFLSL